MDPKDDPEARIRELERSLNEQARTSELGGGGSELGGGQADYVEPPPAPPPGAYTAPYTAAPGAYGSNHPPPPGTYGTPYPQSGSFGGTPFGPVVRSSSAGFRVGWLVFALMSVVGLAIAGAIFAVFYTTSRSIPDLPTFGNDGNITVKPPSITVAPPSITVGQVPGPTAGSSVPTVAPGGTVSVSGANNAETVVCDGGAGQHQRLLQHGTRSPALRRTHGLGLPEQGRRRLCGHHRDFRIQQHGDLPLRRRR